MEEKLTSRQKESTTENEFTAKIMKEKELRDIVESEGYKNAINDLICNIIITCQDNIEDIMKTAKLEYIISKAMLEFSEKKYPIDDILKIIHDKDLDELLTIVLEQVASELNNRNLIITQKGIDQLLSYHINKDGYIYVNILVTKIFKHNYEVIRTIIKRIKPGSNISSSLLHSVFNTIFLDNYEQFKNDEETIDHLINILVDIKDIENSTKKINALLLSISDAGRDVDVLIEFMTRIINKINNTKTNKTK